MLCNHTVLIRRGVETLRHPAVLRAALTNEHLPTNATHSASSYESSTDGDAQSGTSLGAQTMAMRSSS